MRTFNGFQEMVLETTPPDVFDTDQVDSLIENDAIPPSGYNRQPTPPPTFSATSPPTKTGAASSDPITPVAPVSPTMSDSYIPPWGKSLDERVGTLEQQMKQVVQGIARIEEKLS